MFNHLDERNKTGSKLRIGDVSNSTFDKEDEVPYCTDCGNEDLAYLDQYANGEHWECKECKKQFMW